MSSHMVGEACASHSVGEGGPRGPRPPPHGPPCGFGGAGGGICWSLPGRVPQSRPVCMWGPQFLLSGGNSHGPKTEAPEEPQQVTSGRRARCAAAVVAAVPSVLCRQRGAELGAKTLSTVTEAATSPWTEGTLLPKSEHGLWLKTRAIPKYYRKPKQPLIPRARSKGACHHRARFPGHRRNSAV